MSLLHLMLVDRWSVLATLHSVSALMGQGMRQGETVACLIESQYVPGSARFSVVLGSFLQSRSRSTVTVEQSCAVKKICKFPCRAK